MTDEQKQKMETMRELIQEVKIDSFKRSEEARKKKVKPKNV